jgi:hypothetical protein
VQIDTATVAEQALARFLRALSAAAIEFAQDLEAPRRGQRQRSLDEVNLGTLQRAVATVPGMDTDEGVSPRQITQSLERQDEPNIRTALVAMHKRGVVERAPGPGPQRWRLAEPYR